MVKIRRLKPGATTALKAVRSADGRICTTPREIAQHLVSHWQQVFTHRGIDDGALQDWIREAAPSWAAQPLAASSPDQWKVRRKDVAWAVQTARATSPGPDGLVAPLWKRLGGLAVTVLYDAAVSLVAEGAGEALKAAYADELAETGEHPFNLGILCCIPKKPALVHAEHGEVFDPEGTRPLCIVDVSNRIVAAAYKRRWESALGAWVSLEQRGFIPGRSMIKNVVEIEQMAMEVALNTERGLILLLDFKAAFPSVSHAYMKKCMEGYGLPQAEGDGLGL